MYEEEHLQFPGYVSVKEAAAMLGYKEDRIWYYIRQQRLLSRRIDGRSMISKESVCNFHVKPRGRLRKNVALWSVYRGGATVYAMQIDVLVRSGKQVEWQEKVQSILNEQKHLFFGSMRRYIFVDRDNHDAVVIQLVWKDTELAEETIQHDLKIFKDDFAGVLDWDMARYTTMQTLLHTL